MAMEQMPSTARTEAVVEGRSGVHCVTLPYGSGICCRAVAEGKNADTKVSDGMSEDIVTTPPDEVLESCCNKLEETRIRRAVVTDSKGQSCRMLAQPDIARDADGSENAELVQEISKAQG